MKRNVWLLHVATLLLVSVAFESLFLDRGLNVMDEGWPLHAAMELHADKTLYDEVFWVFPPGHLLPAWIGYWIDPPGLVATRVIYAAFTVLLCVAMYFLARCLMPADFALLAGLMVAVAAPNSHWMQAVFGYRYLVFSVVVLLLLYRRLESGDPRWLLAGGVLAGVALFFRLTPAAAVSAAVAVAIVAADRRPRLWIRDGLYYAAGLSIVSIPVLVYFHGTVGIERLMIEMSVRPMEMMDLQDTPMPELVFDATSRDAFSRSVLSLGFRLYPLMYALLIAGLAWQWLRAVRARRPFEHCLLLAVAVWGGIYFVRSLVRSDEPHLDSAIPPVALVLAWLLSRAGARLTVPGGRAPLARFALISCALGAWVFASGADRYLDRDGTMGATPLASVADRILVSRNGSARELDRKIPLIQQYARPDQTVLVMTNAPLLYVLAQRHSPGYHDVVMPGTFRTSEEERRFVERLQADPPAVVVWPVGDFDGIPERGLAHSAPMLSRWVRRSYRLVGDQRLYRILVPRPGVFGSADDA